MADSAGNCGTTTLGSGLKLRRLDGDRPRADRSRQSGSRPGTCNRATDIRRQPPRGWSGRRIDRCVHSRSPPPCERASPCNAQLRSARPPQRHDRKSIEKWIRYARPSAGHVACWHVCRRITKFTIMCGRVIQSSGPLRYAIVDGMNVRDSRAHNYPPRWNAAPSVIALSEQHLLRVLKSYASYYHSARTHRSLDKDAPLPRPVQPIGRIVSHALVGGLHHQYARI
jgi:hypothetical protein